ncbi:MAG: response regulator [Bdellovibrionaceae bacterium]|nr:response regulator [Pseudobdellovibrionaceae bacterium]
MTGSSKGNPHAYRILIVDDEADLRTTLVKALSSRGYVPLEADGAVSAIELLRKEKVDVIISDVRMPNGSARDLLNWINRAQPADARTPVILMSGYSEVIEYLACQLGVTIFLTKPLDLEVLSKAVEQALALVPLKKAN